MVAAGDVGGVGLVVAGNDAPGDVVTAVVVAGGRVGVGSGRRVVVVGQAGVLAPGLVVTVDRGEVSIGEVSIGAEDVGDGAPGDVVTGDVVAGDVATEVVEGFVVVVGTSSPPPDASAVPATAIPPSTTAPAASTSRLRSKTAPRVRGPPLVGGPSPL